MRAFSAVLLAALAAPVFGQYAWYFTDPMQSLQTNDWTSTGNPQFSDFSNGYWGAFTGTVQAPDYYTSLVSKVAVPDGTSSYSVRATIHFPTGVISGAVYLLLRASSTFASSGLPNSGYLVTFACDQEGPSYINLQKIVNGIATDIGQAPSISCSDGMVVRSDITDNGQIISFINGTFTQWAQDTSITSGAPGIVLGNSSMVLSQLQLGPADRIAPGPIPTNGLTYSVYANQINFQWQSVPDDVNGSGVCLYQFLRNDVFFENIATGNSWSDTTVQPGTEYTYTFLAFDRFFNSVQMTVTITTPVTPGGATPTPSSGRRVGVRSSTGAYWGAAPEQIDVLSGNVNFTIPLLKTLARTGWGVGFNIAYNSQNWQQDSGGLWDYGEDVGYGYGWKVLAGSLTPIWAGQTLSYYSFVDSTGAEYRLNQNSGGIWTSVESIYVTYNANTNKLYFRDGSFWFMGCTSATSEPDSGTMYPTTMEDTNGNELS